MGNLVAGLVTEDALRQLFNTTMQARARAAGATGAAHAPCDASCRMRIYQL